MVGRRRLGRSSSSAKTRRCVGHAAGPPAGQPAERVASGRTGSATGAGARPRTHGPRGCSSSRSARPRGQPSVLASPGRRAGDEPRHEPGRRPRRGRPPAWGLQRPRPAADPARGQSRPGARHRAWSPRGPVATRHSCRSPWLRALCLRRCRPRPAPWSTGRPSHRRSRDFRSPTGRHPAPWRTSARRTKGGRSGRDGARRTTVQGGTDQQATPHRGGPGPTVTPCQPARQARPWCVCVRGCSVVPAR